jgi:hypothetical protein
MSDGTVTETPGAGTYVLTYSFTRVGAHQVVVRVTDDDGGAATAVVRVVVHLPGEAFALSTSGLITIARTPFATCPPDESHTVATLSTPVGSLTALHADCTLDRDNGTTVARWSLGSINGDPIGYGTSRGWPPSTTTRPPPSAASWHRTRSACARLLGQQIILAGCRLG